MIRVCFVCLGNICRSPTAEGIMRSLLAEAGLEHAVAVDSAGTGSWHTGAAPDERSREAALERGIELVGEARSFRSGDYDEFDYILAVDVENWRVLRERAPHPEAGGKVHLLRRFDPASPERAEVPDPYHGGPGGFGRVFDICEAACRGLLEHLIATHRLG